MPLKEESGLHRDLGVEAEWLALSLLKTCRETLWKTKGSKVIVWGVIVIYAFIVFSISFIVFDCVSLVSLTRRITSVCL